MNGIGRYCKKHDGICTEHLTPVGAQMLDMLKLVAACDDKERLWTGRNIAKLMPEIRALIQRAEGGESDPS